MEYLYPHVDVSEVNSNAICYAFDDNILVAFSTDSTVETYTKINDKYYRTYVDNIYTYTNYHCYSYSEISEIPHSSSGLVPFYAFLCVCIFGILCWVPYRILLKPVMPRI